MSKDHAAVAVLIREARQQIADLLKSASPLTKATLADQLAAKGQSTEIASIKDQLSPVRVDPISQIEEAINPKAYNPNLVAVRRKGEIPTKTPPKIVDIPHTVSIGDEQSVPSATETLDPLQYELDAKGKRVAVKKPAKKDVPPPPKDPAKTKTVETGKAKDKSILDEKSVKELTDFWEAKRLDKPQTVLHNKGAKTERKVISSTKPELLDYREVGSLASDQSKPTSRGKTPTNKKVKVVQTRGIPPEPKPSGVQIQTTPTTVYEQTPEQPVNYNYDTLKLPDGTVLNRGTPEHAKELFNRLATQIGKEALGDQSGKGSERAKALGGPVENKAGQFHSSQEPRAIPIKREARKLAEKVLGIGPGNVRDENLIQKLLHNYEAELDIPPADSRELPATNQTATLTGAPDDSGFGQTSEAQVGQAGLSVRGGQSGTSRKHLYSTITQRATTKGKFNKDLFDQLIDKRRKWTQKLIGPQKYALYAGPVGSDEEIAALDKLKRGAGHLGNEVNQALRQIVDSKKIDPNAVPPPKQTSIPQSVPIKKQPVSGADEFLQDRERITSDVANLNATKKKEFEKLVQTHVQNLEAAQKLAINKKNPNSVKLPDEIKATIAKRAHQQALSDIETKNNKFVETKAKELYDGYVAEEVKQNVKTNPQRLTGIANITDARKGELKQKALEQAKLLVTGNPTETPKSKVAPTVALKGTDVSLPLRAKMKKQLALPGVQAAAQRVMQLIGKPLTDQQSIALAETIKEKFFRPHFLKQTAANKNVTDPNKLPPMPLPNDNELKSIIQGIMEPVAQSKVTQTKKSEEPMANLRKDDETPAESPETSSPSPNTGGSETGSAPSPATDSSAGMDPSASPNEDPSMGEDPSEIGGDATGDLQSRLVEAYSQLSDEELQAHFEALKQVAMAKSGGSPESAGGVPPEAQGQPGGAPPAGPGGEQMGSDPMAGGVPGGETPPPVPQEDPLAQSEKLNALTQNLQKSEAKAQELEKAVGLLTASLESLLKRPERKSFGPRDVNMAKSEKPVGQKLSELNKSEQIKVLNTLSRNPSLTKTERGLINDYVLHKSVKVNELETIFEKYNK